MSEASRILVINPGSTSTKVGVHRRDGAEWQASIPHPHSDLERFHGLSALAQADYRASAIDLALAAAGYSGAPLAAVAGRGGLLPPLACGTYRVDNRMIEELRLARRGEHACNLGAVLADRFARRAGVDAYIVDPVTVDEWQPCARLSGTPLIERNCIGHALSTKAVARRFAHAQGRAYEDLRLVILHLGSGITVSAHRGGRMIDNNTPEEGPLGPDRTGWLPVRQLIRLCFSETWNARQLDRMVFGDGGLFAYLGTRDLQQVEQRINAGDAHAAAVYEAMIYQIAKETGAMAAVLEGRVDALLLTGGMAHSARLIERLRPGIEWIAPLTVYPGEDELRALAEGVFRVLDGLEPAKRFCPEEHPTVARRDALTLGLE